MKKWYVVHPNGRERLDVKDRAEAIEAFGKHWSNKGGWLPGKKPSVRRLIEETQKELLCEKLETL